MDDGVVPGVDVESMRRRVQAYFETRRGACINLMARFPHRFTIASWRCEAQMSVSYAAVMIDRNALIAAARAGRGRSGEVAAIISE